MDANVQVDEHTVLQTALDDVAATIQTWRQQAELAHRTLDDALARVEEFRRQAEAAQGTLATCQDQERRLSSALEMVQRAHEALAQAARQRAEETLAAAERAAAEIVEDARKTAAATLDEARRHAQEELAQARREAESQLLQARAESERLVAEARQQAADITHEAESRLAGIATKVEAFVSREEELARSLEAVVRSHSESLEAATRLRSAVEEEVLPALRRMLKHLRDTQADAVSSPVLSDLRPAPLAIAAVTAGPTAQVSEGEIVVSPVESFTQATRFATTLSQMKGVRSVRLRSYAAAKATIDIVLDEQTLLHLDIKFIDGHPVEVTERSEHRLVLQVTDAPPRPLRG